MSIRDKKEELDGQIVSLSRTIKCDIEGCTNEVTFNPQNVDEVKALPEWVRGYRVTQRGDRKSFGYCSDVCEVQGITAGNHNVPEPKKVTEVTSLEEVKQAVANAEASKALAGKDAGTEAAARKTIELTDGD